MQNRIKKKLSMLFDLKFVRSFLGLRNHGYLYEAGWINSFKTKNAIDILNQPIPWYTYPFIKFVKERLNNQLTVFEYGCGNSTLWYCGRVRSIKSVEHEKGWFDVVVNKTKHLKNVQIIYRNLKTNGEYAKEILNTKDFFDIIVIDGRDRVNCTKYSFNQLKEDGVIIFDNSDRTEYAEAYNLLAEKGFRRLDFWGMGPINTYEWCTSVFYRDKNCFNI